MIYHDEQYLALLRLILDRGHNKGDRTGTGTQSLFGAQLRFDLRQAFPLLTTKKVPLRWVAEELFWFLSGSTDEKDLRAKGVDIWKEWATKEQCARFGREEGDLGPIYSRQWRNFGYPHYGDIPGPDGEPIGIDQIANAIYMLAKSPESRRIIVSAWNPAEATDVALPPCHTLFQFETHVESMADGSPSRMLSCHMYQRSADVFLGVPFNIASYALLTHMMSAVVGYKPGDLVISFGDVHIYNNHREQVFEQLARKPRPSPVVSVDCKPYEQTLLGRLLNIEWSDIRMEGYDPHPKIAAPVAV